MHHTDIDTLPPPQHRSCCSHRFLPSSATWFSSSFRIRSVQRTESSVLITPKEPQHSGLNSRESAARQHHGCPRCCRCGCCARQHAPPGRPECVGGGSERRRRRWCRQRQTRREFSGESGGRIKTTGNPAYAASVEQALEKDTVCGGSLGCVSKPTGESFVSIERERKASCVGDKILDVVDTSS